MPLRLAFTVILLRDGRNGGWVGGWVGGGGLRRESFSAHVQAGAGGRIEHHTHTHPMGDLSGGMNARVVRFHQSLSGALRGFVIIVLYPSVHVGEAVGVLPHHHVLFFTVSPLQVVEQGEGRRCRRVNRRFHRSQTFDRFANLCLRGHTHTHKSRTERGRMK